MPPTAPPTTAPMLSAVEKPREKEALKSIARERKEGREGREGENLLVMVVY